MRTKNDIAALLALGATAALMWGGVRADEPESNQLADVVVTAQKTSEPLSKVPMSIAAVSGASLAEEHITDYADLSRAVPNLSFSSFGGPGQSNI